MLMFGRNKGNPVPLNAKISKKDKNSGTFFPLYHVMDLLNPCFDRNSGTGFPLKYKIPLKIEE